MNIKLEPEDKKPHIQEEPQIYYGYDVPIKVSNSPDAHAEATQHDDAADHTFEINSVTAVKCKIEYPQIKCEHDPYEDPEHQIKYENSFGECSYSQHMTGNKSSGLHENTLDFCATTQGQSLLRGSSPQGRVWRIPLEISSDTLPSGSQSFLNTGELLVVDQVQVPVINVTEKVKHIIETKIKNENKQAPHDCIDILENIVKNEVFTVFKKEAHLVLKKALFYNRNFVCNICFEYFPTAKVMKDHKLSFHQSVSFACDQSDFKSTKASYIKAHQLTHSSNKPPKCECSRKHSLDVVEDTVDNDGKPFKCDECDYKCVYLSYLKKHEIVHSNRKPFKCSSCDYKCKQLSKLKSHQLVHSVEKLYECIFCDYKCKSSAYLKKHSSIHSADTPYVCDECDYSCKWSSALKRHKLVHSREKPLKCNLCDYKCKTSRELNNHQLFHSTDRPYVCDKCDYKSKCSRSLRLHKLIHSSEKPFECTLCNLKFKTAGQLKIHKRVHSGEKPYACNECDFKCKWFGAFKAHRIMHTDKKPLKCNVCNFRCGSSSILIKHQGHHRSQSSENPFKCGLCDYKCKKLFHLKRHFLIHSSDKPFCATDVTIHENDPAH